MVVNIVPLMRSTWLSSTDQKKPAAAPTMQAAMREKPAVPRSPAASGLEPAARLTATPTVPMMQNTSVRVLSRVSTVPVPSPRSSALTMGMTTADDVPPMMSPPSSAVHQSMPMRNFSPTVRQAMAVTMLTTENGAARPADLNRLLSCSPRPLSNRITARVTMARKSPTRPRSSRLRRCRTGPTNSPRIMSNRMSGMRVRSKNASSRCARKTNRPAASTTVCMSFNPGRVAHPNSAEMPAGGIGMRWRARGTQTGTGKGP